MALPVGELAAYSHHHQLRGLPAMEVCGGPKVAVAKQP